jgi:hypothetical protein
VRGRRMPEPVQATESSEAPELEALRKQVSELTAKSATRKATIATLQATIADLQTKLSESANQLQAANVTAPLSAMCQSLSKHTAIFQEQFLKDYSVEMVNGKLALRSKDGKSITSDDGKEVPFERESILKLLLNSKDEEKRILYNAICIATRASGASTAFTTQNTATARTPVHSFGLR